MVYLEQVRDTGSLEVECDNEIEDCDIEFHTFPNDFGSLTTVPTIEHILHTRKMVRDIIWILSMSNKIVSKKNLHS